MMAEGPGSDRRLQVQTRQGEGGSQEEEAPPRAHRGSVSTAAAAGGGRGLSMGRAFCSTFRWRALVFRRYVSGSQAGPQ